MEQFNFQIVANIYFHANKFEGKRSNYVKSDKTSPNIDFLIFVVFLHDSWILRHLNDRWLPQKRQYDTENFDFVSQNCISCQSRLPTIPMLNEFYMEDGNASSKFL